MQLSLTSIAHVAKDLTHGVWVVTAQFLSPTAAGRVALGTIDA